MAVANGTEAIQLALEALGLAAGDEVITSPLSAAFTALAILRAGARPVFADVDPVTLNVTPETVERALTPRTRALLPVHLYGHPADLDPLLELARRRGIPLVEDACQAIGAQYKGRPVGALGGIGALSFYPTKNLGAFGDGGAVLVERPGARGAPAAAAQRRPERPLPPRGRRHQQPPGRDAGGDPARQAGAPRGLDGAAARPRRALRRGPARTPASGAPGEQPYARAVYHLYVVRHPRRDALAAALQGARHRDPRPLPDPAAPAARLRRARGRGAGDFPVAERAAGEILSLPLYPEMTDAQAEAVIRAVREVAPGLR